MREYSCAGRASRRSATTTSIWPLGAARRRWSDTGTCHKTHMYHERTKQIRSDQSRAEQRPGQWSSCEEMEP
jgi:hypothetical protein